MYGSVIIKGYRCSWRLAKPLNGGGNVSDSVLGGDDDEVKMFLPLLIWNGCGVVPGVTAAGSVVTCLHRQYSSTHTYFENVTHTQT